MGGHFMRKIERYSSRIFRGWKSRTRFRKCSRVLGNYESFARVRYERARISLAVSQSRHVAGFELNVRKSSL